MSILSSQADPPTLKNLAPLEKCAHIKKQRLVSNGALENGVGDLLGSLVVLLGVSWVLLGAP